MSQSDDKPAPERGIYCNRTLNLRSIRAIGYDMDYTLIHYHVDLWEERAYAYAVEHLAGQGWPVAGLEFVPELVIRGLVIDTELGNVVKADRFGYVKAAMHGTRMLPWEEQREVYAREFVDLRDERWAFMNTLFSMSEACLYGQLVERFDRGELPGVHGYADLHRRVKSGLGSAHMEGRLKAEIIANPERFVDLDPDTPLALLDQREAGKKLLLVTNSEWSYTKAMMAYAFDRFLPASMTWRDLFDLKVVFARKPLFFSQYNPIYEVADEEGLLRPVVGPLRSGGTYLGGDAATIEQHLGLSGAEILYVGDHIYADVHVSKSTLRWRTALVARELEPELVATASFAAEQTLLTELMRAKEPLERRDAALRLQRQRLTRGYGPQPEGDLETIQAAIDATMAEMAALDEQISPLAKRSGELVNPRWGLLLRAGNDKSHLARQIERHADVYTSRVSNFLRCTPHRYLRSPRSRLPHDA